jgi:hypothetical protein
MGKMAGDKGDIFPLSIDLERRWHLHDEWDVRENMINK